MAKSNFYENDKIEFGQIVLSHIQQILKLSLLDLGNPVVCGKYKTSVITLSDVLFSYYDKPMTTAYNKFKEDSNKSNGRSYRIFRELFRELLALTKRVDYFKSAVYGEDGDVQSGDDFYEDDN